MFSTRAQILFQFIFTLFYFPFVVDCRCALSSVCCIHTQLNNTCKHTRARSGSMPTHQLQHHDHHNNPIRRERKLVRRTVIHFV